MTWYFHNTPQEFTEEDIKDNFGFVRNYKKKSNSMVRITTPGRFYTSVKPEVNVLIGRLLRYSADMHY